MLKKILKFSPLISDICLYTSGLQRLAGVHDPPKSCDIPKEAEFHGDYYGGSGGTGNGLT